MTSIKPTWVVCGDDGYLTGDADGEPQEFKSERAAIKRAKDWLGSMPAGSEAWIYRLSHVVSLPPSTPEVEVVK